MFRLSPPWSAESSQPLPLVPSQKKLKELPSEEVCPLGAPPRLAQPCHLQVILPEHASRFLEGCCSPRFWSAPHPLFPKHSPSPTTQLPPLPQAKLAFIDLASLCKSLNFYVTEIYSERKPQVTMGNQQAVPLAGEGRQGYQPWSLGTGVAGDMGRLPCGRLCSLPVLLQDIQQCL